jgi:transcriptional regulator with XRE-family HTH domain
MPIGDHIRDLRWGRRLKQGELAHRAGIAQNTLSQIELGKTTPSVPTLEKIARGLNLDLSELLEEPALAGTPGKAEASETGPTEAGAEEERRVIPQSAANLKRYIEDMKELKELREAEMEELGKGVDLPRSLLVQMALADKGLRDLLEELGVLDFAEAVRAGRAMAQPEAIPLCHELLRRLDGLERLSAQAEAASGVAKGNLWAAGIKTASGAESFLAEQQTATEGS